jgi:hypothetical protein
VSRRLRDHCRITLAGHVVQFMPVLGALEPEAYVGPSLRNGGDLSAACAYAREIARIEGGDPLDVIESEWVSARRYIASHWPELCSAAFAIFDATAGAERATVPGERIMHAIASAVSVDAAAAVDGDDDLDFLADLSVPTCARLGLALHEAGHALIGLSVFLVPEAVDMEVQ